VDIGTTNPARALDISSGHLRLSDGYNVEWGGGTNYVRGSNASNYLLFTTNATERMRIDSSGNVGIGTSSANKSSSSTALTVNTATAGNYSALELSSGDTLNWHINANNAAVYDVTAGTRPRIFYTNGTERMRIDSSGNVGIGTSSPVANTPLTLQGQSGYTDNLWLKSVGTNIDSRINIAPTGTGLAQVNNTNGTPIAFQISGSEKMRIDNSGNVTLSGSDGKIYLPQTPSTYNWIGDAINQTGIIIIPTNDGTSERLSFVTNNAEHMRINASGNVLFGCTSFPSASVAGFTINGTSSGNASSSGASTAAYNHLLFYNGNGLVGYISTSGSTTSFANISDYRLKTAVNYDWDATTRLKQLRPARFEWIADGDDAVPVDGFLAHEVQSVVPEAITGTHNGMRDEEYEVTPAVLDEDGNVVTPAVMGTRSVPEYQGIDQSKLTPLLTKALIEAVEKIEQLEARIVALEAN
jgi:hypothetical protein